MADTRPESLPFDEAIGFLRRKVRLPTETWTDLWEGMHARAFVVAGATKAQLVADFHRAVTDAIAEGKTLADFRKTFDAIVERHGWSYRGSRRWRSRVIYNTNVRMAHAAGRWSQIQRVKARRPWLRYVAVQDLRIRPKHLAWHGTVLAADDDFWRTHYPPNGWYCRCTVQQLSDRDLERFGHQPSDRAPEVRMENRTVRTPTGEASMQVPEGIDTGFSYNVGEAGFGRGADAVAMEKHGPWRPLVAPGGSRPADPGPLASAEPKAAIGERAGSEDELRAALRSAIGGDETVFTDPTSERIAVSQAIVDHMLSAPGRHDGREAFFPFIPELVEDPAEIWAGFAVSDASGRVGLRRRYVKMLDLGRGRVVTLVADTEGNRWTGLTFFHRRVRDLVRLRCGLRVHPIGDT